MCHSPFVPIAIWSCPASDNRAVLSHQSLEPRGRTTCAKACRSARRPVGGRGRRTARRARPRSPEGRFHVRHHSRRGTNRVRPARRAAVTAVGAWAAGRARAAESAQSADAAGPAEPSAAAGPAQRADASAACAAGPAERARSGHSWCARFRGRWTRERLLLPVGPQRSAPRGRGDGHPA